MTEITGDELNFILSHLGLEKATKIKNALKLEELLKERIKNTEPIEMLDGCYELDFYKALLEEAKK